MRAYERFAQVPGGFTGAAGRGFRAPELEEQLRAHHLWRLLVQRAAQQRNGGSRGAARLGATRSGAQVGHHPQVSRGRGANELQRDALRPGVTLPQQRGRARVGGHLLRCRQGRARGAGQERMPEAQRRDVGQQTPARQLARGERRLHQGQVRQGRRQVELDVVAEHRDRTGERLAPRPQPIERHPDRSRDGGRRHVGHATGIGGGEGDALRAQPTHEFTEQERVAARGIVARCRELGLDRAAVRGSQEALDAGDVEGGRLEHIRPGLTAQLVEHRRNHGVLGGTRSDDQRDRQGVDATRQIRDESQRRLIGPMGVVDREQERTVIDEHGHQGVEPAQDGVGRRLRGIGKIEDHARRDVSDSPT
jgi:hypothetical protein